MAARFATQDFWWTNAAGSSMFVEEGSTWDSITSPVAVALPAMFTATAPSQTNLPHMTGRRLQHLAQYPSGSQL
jgi:hypothetical protein